MKKISILSIALFSFTVVWSQQPVDVNALMKKAGEDVKAEKYTSALSSLEQVKTELTNLLGAQYLALIPAKINGWETKPEPPKMTNMPAMPMMGNNLASRTFTRKDTSKAPEMKLPTPKDTTVKVKMPQLNLPKNTGPRTNTITITISRNAMQAGNIVKAHEKAAKQPGGKENNTLLIKDAKATQTYNENSQLGTIAVLLGPGTVLEIRGNGVKTAAELMAVAKGLDMDKLKKLAAEE